MTPAEVAQALADRLPGRPNVLPTPMRSGTRVAITLLDDAHGVVCGSWSTGHGAGEATARIRLDTTGILVDVPWLHLGVPTLPPPDLPAVGQPSENDENGDGQSGGTDQPG